MDIVSGSGDVLLAPHWQPAETVGSDHLRLLNRDAIAYVPMIEPIEHRVSVELEGCSGFNAPQPVALSVVGEENQLLADTVVCERRTIQFHLPAGLPKLYSLRFHVDGAPNSPAVPNAIVPSVRVFSIRAEPLRPEVVPLLAGFRVGRGGWYLLEECVGELFRWVNNDAEILVTNAGERRLELDMAPGPALGSMPLTLNVLHGGEQLAHFVIYSRGRIGVDLPQSCVVPYSIMLHVERSGAAMPGNQRILNFRVFHIPPYRCER